MTIHVYEVPPPHRRSNGFCFHGPVPIVFENVDWFACNLGETEEKPDHAVLEEFIKGKKYFNPNKTYLVIGDGHCFTMGAQP